MDAVWRAEHTPRCGVGTVCASSQWLVIARASPHEAQTALTCPRVQEHRALLETGCGLRRCEVGEIANRIGQLYYHFYLRQGDTLYLDEAFIFYEAIRRREMQHVVVAQSWVRTQHVAGRGANAPAGMECLHTSARPLWS